MTRMPRILIFAVLGLLLAGPASAGSLKKLAKKLAKGLKMESNRKVAVLSFPYHNGGRSSIPLL